MPKEIWHLFQTHTDSEHTISEGLSFEMAHHHCVLLKADQAVNSITPPVFIQVPEPRPLFFYVSFQQLEFAQILQREIATDKNRGPPVV